MRLTEEAFVSEFGKLVSHLTERLSGSDDGKPKVFRDSAVENLSEFFTRFRQLNVGNNAQLDELVAQAQRVIRGVEPQQLRDSNACGRTSQHNSRPCSRSSMACSSIGHGATSSAPVSRKWPDGAPDLAAWPGSLSIQRDDRTGGHRGPDDRAGQSCRTRCQRSLVRRSFPERRSTLGPFERRSDALQAEAAWLSAHRLQPA